MYTIGKKAIGMSFANAESLEVKPKCLTQLRALGIGLAAFGVASYLLGSADDSDGERDE